MVKNCRNIIAFALLATMAVATITFAEVTPVTQGQSDTTSKTKGQEKNNTQKQFRDDSNTSGTRTSKDWQKGFRKSTRKELSNAMEKSRNNTLSQEVSIPPLFIEPLMAKNPAYRVNISDLLINPVERDGLIYTTYQEGLQKIAQNRGVADGLIKKDKVRETMALLARTGIWIQRQLGGLRLASNWGYEDWQDLVNRIVEIKSDDISKVTMTYRTAGTCRMIGEYSRIQCGDCILDVTNNSGMPELVCSGKRIFTADSAGGLNMKASITDGFSLRDTETQAQSDETFRSFTEAINKYVDDAIRKGKGIEATEVKKLAYSSATQDTGKFDIVVKGLDHQDDAQKILGAAGIR